LRISSAEHKAPEQKNERLFILYIDKNHQKKERKRRDWKARGFPGKPGDKTEPGWKDIEKHYI
jgi:hypothetical protein